MSTARDASWAGRPVSTLVHVGLSLGNAQVRPAAGSQRSESAQLPSREPCLVVVPVLNDAQIVHLLYKIVMVGGYILHPLHPLHIRYAHRKPSMFWRFGAQIWRICER